MKEQMKIAVYGAGAMGTVLGGFLSDCGLDAEVDLVSRNREHIRAMKEKGARILCAATGDTYTKQVNALLPEEMTEQYDVIFLMTKQKDNARTAGFLKNFLKADGALVSAQNGLPEELLAEIVGEDRVYGAVCAWGANLVGDGTAELTSDPSAMTMEIGSWSGRCGKLKEIREILSAVGEVTGNPAFVTVTENLAGARWSKLAINAAFSGLSVVTGLTFGEIAKGRKSRAFALDILRECFAVASELGVKLEKIQGHDMEKLLGAPGFFGTRKALFLLPIAMRRHKLLVSGMLRDLEKGKRCEIDYIDGAVSRLGDKCSVDTPLCDKVVETVHGIENGLCEISPKNLDFFS